MRIRHLSHTSLAISFMLLGGCIAARPYTLLKYDSKTDTFHELRIYADITGGNALMSGEMNAAGLPPLWRDRDRYIPDLLCLYGKPRGDSDAAPATLDFALKRIGERKYQVFTNDQPDSLRWPDRASIQPGKLFLSPRKTLCYYHEVALPGSGLDEQMRADDAADRKSLKEKIEGELARRQAGGNRKSWDNFQRKMVAYWDHWPKADFENLAGTAKKEPLDPLLCLDDSSLNLLLGAAKAGQPFYSRNGSEFRFSCPLSAEDGRRAKAAFDAVKEKVLKPDSATKPAAETEKDENVERPFEFGISLATVATMLQATVEDQQRFVVTLRVPPFIDLTPETIRAEKPRPMKAVDYQEAIDAMKAAGAAIDEKLTLDEVIRGFTARSP